MVQISLKISVSNSQHLEIEISYPRNCQNRPKDASIRRKVCSNAQTIHDLQLLRCKHPSESQIVSTNLRMHLSKKINKQRGGHLLTTPAAPAGFPRSIQKLPSTILDTSHEEITRWRFQEPVVGMIFPTHTGILSVKGAVIAMIHGPW